MPQSAELASVERMIPEVQPLNTELAWDERFEIDLFGYARSMSEAAFYRYLATEQGQKSAACGCKSTFFC